MVKVCLVMPCYKRPEIAERFLDSVEKYVPYVKHALVLLQPEMDFMPKERSIHVEWVRSKQMPVGLARTKAVKEAIIRIDPEVLWISDDDIICNEQTRIEDCMPLVMTKGVGVVGVSRLMRKDSKAEAYDWIRPLLYIGGGFLIRRVVLDKVPVWFTEDVAEEKEFCLHVYLEGYDNYGTKRAFAIHKQGVSSGGGIKQLIIDSKKGEMVDVMKPTRFGGKESLLMSCDKEPYMVGNGDSIMSVSAHSVPTAFAKSMHNKKRQFVI